ncbi:SH3 domain-containing protein [Metabacillus litoralis]|uniref:SH3 domain-containing protein n=1 Tax=Metabacillus litoralis TaxID=152268 RepID=UPI001CFE6ACC|nr:SH3 domain-containing protein [Metabacillus litoralis]
METIINQVFWIWVPLTLLPVWLRIAIVTYVLIILARPIIFRLLPKLIEWASMLVKKGVEYLSYPLMVLFHKFLSKRRSNGDHRIPYWLEAGEDFCAVLLKSFGRLEDLSKRRTRNKARIKKMVRLVAFSLAILLPLAIINNPTTSYSKTWNNFEAWVTKEKVQKDLGYDLTKLQANVKGKFDEVSSKVNPKTLKLKEKYKDGGNIRETPNLNGNIVDDLTQGETITYLEEEQTDNQGIRWLKVETPNGKTGWISAKIVE